MADGAMLSADEGEQRCERRTQPLASKHGHPSQGAGLRESTTSSVAKHSFWTTNVLLLVSAWRTYLRRGIWMPGLGACELPDVPFRPLKGTPIAWQMGPC